MTSMLQQQQQQQQHVTLSPMMYPIHSSEVSQQTQQQITPNASQYGSATDHIDRMQISTDASMTSSLPQSSSSQTDVSTSMEDRLRFYETLIQNLQHQIAVDQQNILSLANMITAIQSAQMKLFESHEVLRMNQMHMQQFQQQIYPQLNYLMRNQPSHSLPSPPSRVEKQVTSPIDEPFTGGLKIKLQMPTKTPKQQKLNNNNNVAYVSDFPPTPNGTS